MNQMIRRVKGFFQLGERDAFTRVDELASLGEESLHLLIKILTGSPNGLSDIETCTNRISLLEKQGDKIVQLLEEMFGKGSISAILMREFERLADSVDGVLDRAHALSRQIRRVTKRPLREAKEFDEIYGSWEVLDYASFHNYIETTIEADDILDRCEDASDLVIVIMKGLGA